MAEKEPEPQAQIATDELQRQIDALDKNLTDGVYGLIDEVLVIHKGEPAFHLKYDRKYEELVDLNDVKDGPLKYDSGAYAYADPDWHPYYQNTNLHTLMSVTKTVTSLLIGIAETRGDLPDIREAKVLDYIDDRYKKPQRDEWWDAVTIEHLVSLTMNLDWNESDTWSEDPEKLSDLEMLEWQVDDWVQYTLDRPMAGPPGGVFAYNGGAVHLLSAVIEHISGKSAAEYAEEHLFSPLGVQNHYWKTTPAGLNDAMGGLYLTAEDTYKLCKLMISRGDWDGQRVISEDYANRALTPISPLPEGWSQLYDGAEMGYGYGWVTEQETDQTALKPFMVNSGYAGQNMYCLPANNAIVVFLAYNAAGTHKPEFIKDEYETSDKLKKRIDEIILPLLEARA
ncbi:MAG: serine hydrolase [Pseudomonadota bacterium]